MDGALHRLDATGQARLVREGEVGPRALAEHAIARIEAIDPAVNAVIHRRYERALAELDDTSVDAPFRGVPILVKDLGAGRIAGEPFHQGNRVLRDLDWRSPDDSYLVARLFAAGFVLLGKTNVPEFGLHATTQPAAYGPTHNPWDLDRTAGGSSGGAAAAVAAGMVPVAHGSDGGGSIRIPASACGLVGLKTSRGRISVGPQMGESGSGNAVEGALTRSVRDAAAMLDVLAGRMPGDPVTAPPPRRPFVEELGEDPGRLRVGVTSRRFGSEERAHVDAVAATDRAARLLEQLGHHVEPGAPVALGEPDILLAVAAVHMSTRAAALDALGEETGHPFGPDDVEPAYWATVEIGRAVTGPQYAAAKRDLELFGRRLASWWADGFDLLLTPALGEPPPTLDELADVPGEPLASLLRAAPMTAFFPTWNHVGQPAVVLPIGRSSAGLPMGVQLVADYGREDLLLAVAAQLEGAAPWADAWPAIASGAPAPA